MRNIQKTLLVIVILSFIVVFHSSIFLNQVRNLTSFLFDTTYQWRERIGLHEPGGVCGLGIIVGWLWFILLIVELALVLHYDKKILRHFTLVLVGLLSVYIISLFFMNSVFDYRVLRPQQWGFYRGIGLFEYMSPFFVLQFIFVAIVLTHT